MIKYFSEINLSGSYKKSLQDRYLNLLSTSEIKDFSPNVYLLPTEDGLIPGIETMGEVLNQRSVVIKFSPTKTTEENLVSATIHEIAHLIREKFYKYGNSLSESIVTEGIAIYSEVEFCDIKSRPYLFEVREDVIEMCLQEFRSDDSFASSTKWLFGDNDIKKWTGYSIGYSLVRSFMENHSFAELVRADIKTIYESY